MRKCNEINNDIIFVEYFCTNFFKNCNFNVE